jgi:aquaporin Z
MDTKKYAAEAIGTFWLTFAGCGSAVIAAGFPQVGIGLVGVSFAFGLSVVTMAYAIGHVSGCHLNPAVTVGLAAGGRFPAGQVAPYIFAQVIGAVAAAALLYVIASGAAGSMSPRALRPTAMTRIRPASTAWWSASSPKW